MGVCFDWSRLLPARWRARWSAHRHEDRVVCLPLEV